MKLSLVVLPPSLIARSPGYPRPPIGEPPPPGGGLRNGALYRLTSPVAETVAIVALLVVHVTVRPVSVLPAESFAVAASCTVAPTWIEAVAGLTETVATVAGVGGGGGGGVGCFFTLSCALARTE